MLKGAHESTHGGFFRSIQRAVADGCDSVQLFTNPPKTWRQNPLEDDQIARFRSTRGEAGFGKVVSHASYLVNTCSANPDTRRKARAALVSEARRCDLLGIDLLVLHPGSPGKEDQLEAMELVAVALLEAIEESASVSLLLENTAGQGRSIGWRFEHLARIIERAGSHRRIGVCFDTCHAFAAGYDLRRPEGALAAFDELDSTIGAGRLGALHLNDSTTGLGSRVDRHARLGEGQIGLDLFRWIVNEPRFDSLPGIVETPLGQRETYRREMDLLESLSDH